MLADVQLLHQADFYKITNFKCHCDICSVSNLEYNGSLCLSFMIAGFFEYQTFRRKDEVHAGRLLLSKPGYEHTTRHIDGHPDIVTCFEFTAAFYQQLREQYKQQTGWYFNNPDIHSLLFNNTPELEHLHQFILQKIKSGQASHLEMNEWVVVLLEKAIGALSKPAMPERLADSLKRNHISTMEAARDYLFTHFKEAISLHQVASHCHVSPFHFSRLFKKFWNTSPHQYLTAIRLQHAAILLKTTEQPVSAIAYDCGFNSLEHFATAYRQRFNSSPSVYRRQLV